jgi:hypothetical protein
MNIDEAVAKACLEPTLLDALTWIAVWESERAIQQAKKFFETGERTGSNGAGWDTCFKVCFEKVMQTWKTPSPADANRHLEALKEILESAKTTGEDMSHLWLIERIGKALRAPGKIEERRNAAPEMEYLVGQRLAPGLVVAPESIAEKLTLVEKMNADNAKMRGEYLKEKQKLELQVSVIRNYVNEEGVSDTAKVIRVQGVVNKPVCEHDWLDLEPVVHDGEQCKKCFEVRTKPKKQVDLQQSCDHKWSHIEDHHVYCPKCKKTADLCFTCETEKQNVGGILVCLNCRGH